ncbi:MAG: hypothetical protein RH860_04030 [Cytophagales bacterium]
MLSRVRNSILTKFLWGIIGLYLLNISVDTADPKPEHIPEDLSFNDQESIVEIVVEKIFGFEDAIKEYDDHDAEDHNKKKNVKIDLVVHVINVLKNDSNRVYKRKKRYPDYEARLIKGFDEKDNPPPKI